MEIPKPNCADIYELGLLSADLALKQILSALTTINEYEYVNIQKAKGRILFHNIISQLNVPRHNNSAVDGYAFNVGDLSTKESTSLKVVGLAYTGKPYTNKINARQCIRIMTGALIPEGVDTVVMQEHIVLKNRNISVNNPPKIGENIRLAGEDIKLGETILHAGRLITAADIGLLASVGITEIKVQRKLKIALASTGNEVIDIGSACATGQIYDSNKYCLYAALLRPSIEIINMGILADNPKTLQNNFDKYSKIVDVIISSGGVSVGDADYVKTALQKSGKINFWKIAIKPGRPLAFGRLGKSIFFGLPGNPVAVMVTFYQFVLPALEFILGIKDRAIVPTFKAKTLENIRKKPGRTEIVRAILQQDNDGKLTVKTTGKQGSGVLSSMSLANAFIVLEHDKSSVKIGEMVTVQAFSSLC